MTHTIIVDNISCGGCVSSIKKGLSSLEGVEKVDVNQTTHTVSVEGTVEKSTLTKKLIELGYPERNQ